MTNSTNEQESAEGSIDLPLDRFNPETLLRMIEEFVTRDWSELSDDGFSLEEKVAQVLRQLQEKRARVVFDLTTEQCNIVATTARPGK